ANYQELCGDDYITAYEAGEAVSNKQFYFTVTAYDDTRTWTDPTSSSGTGNGNASTSFYKGTSEMLNLIEGKNTSFADFSVSKLRNYLNGSDTTYAGNTELDAILSAAETQSVVSEDAVSDIGGEDSTWLTFQINPRNNPTYTYSGFSVDESMGQSDSDNYSSDGFHKYYPGSTINVSLSTGLDNTNLDTSTISFYFVKEGEENKSLLWTWNEDVALAYAQESDATITLADIISNPTAYRYTVTASSENTDSLSKQISIASTEISTGYQYYLLAEGRDIDDQSLITSSDDTFGFFAASNASPATISVGDNSGKMNLPNLAPISQATFTTANTFGLSGTVLSEGVPLVENIGLEATITLTDGLDSTRTVSIEEIDLDSSDYNLVGSSYTYDWSYCVAASDEMTALLETPGYYVVTIEIKANNGNESSITRTYYLDNEAPSISITSIGSAVSASEENTYYINPAATFSISGITQDNYATTNTTTLKINVGDSTVLEQSVNTQGWTFADLNLSGYASSDSAIVTITATDTASNTCDATTICLDFDATAPALVSGDYVGDAAYSSTAWFNTSSVSISGNWTETQSGVKAVYYEIVAPDGTAAMTRNSYSTCKYFTTEDTATAGRESYSQILKGFSQGANTLRMLAVDNLGNVSAIVERTVNVDTVSPTMTGSSATTLTNADSDRTLSIAASNISDATSGIDYTSAVVTVGSTSLDSSAITFNATDGLSALISKTLLASLSGYVNVTATVKDKAGNSVQASMGTLNVDNTAPSVSINPESNYFVNKVAAGATYSASAT
nr:hypothetical protein [Treponemataceae bacterium]